MAYSQNWNPKDKLSREDMLKALTEIAPSLTDSAFFIRFETDGGGSMYTIYVEEFPDTDLSPWHADNLTHLAADKLRGWRIIRATVAPGYIDCFLKAKKESE